MSISGIIIAAVIVGGTGLFIGVFLGFSGRAFYVEVDEREGEILAVLPGNNCGGCGYAGCSGLAWAIAEGKAELNSCPVGGSEVAKKIGRIMGMDVEDQARQRAFVKCGGTCEKAQYHYKYYGIEDCYLVNMMQDGGPKGCSFGCIGYGSCVKVCPFDAIHVIEGISVVNKEKCKACGKCIAVCPKHLIEMVPYDQKTFVQCSSNEKGKKLMDVCQVGCIGCRICEKNCEFGAVTVTDNLAHIDPEKCTNCGVCAQKCPRKIITPREIAN